MATRQTFSCSIHADGCCSWTYRNLYVTICESQDLEMRVEGTVRFFEPVATSFYLFFLRRLERREKKKKPKDKYPKSQRSSGWTGAAMRATFSTLTDVGRIIFRWWIIIVVLYLFVVDVFFFFRFKIGEGKPVAVTSYVPPDSRTSSTQTDNNRRFFFFPFVFLLKCENDVTLYRDGCCVQRMISIAGR